MSDDNDKTVRLNSEDENDKTVRINDDTDKTVRVNDDDKTVRINDTDDDKTVRINDADDDKTVRVNDTDKTTRIEDTVISADGSPDLDKTTRLSDDVISADTPKKKEIKANTVVKDSGKQEEVKKHRGIEEFELDSGIYKNIKSLGAESGEASVYLVEKDGAKYALKLYFHDMKPKILILDQLSKLNIDGVVRINEYGYAYVGEKRFYELMEFAEGGTLDETLPIRDEKAIRSLITKVSKTLDQLHKNQIIHRDIKPGNIFLRKKNTDQYLLGDFGISSLMDSEADRLKTKQNRTDVFAAPEIFLSMGGMDTELDYAVDWYALGISVLFLWTGHDPYRGVPSGSLANVKYEGKYNFPDSMPENFRDFVRGCCTPNYKKRWAYNEIERWLNGETVDIYQEEKKLDYEPFNFDPQSNMVAKTPEELAGFMEKDPELGKRYLYKGKIQAWLEKAEMNRLAMFIDEIPVKQYSENEDAGLKAAIYLLDPDKQFVGLNGKVCETDVDFAELFLDNFNHYEKELTDPDADFYIYLRARQLGEKVKEFLSIFEKYSPTYGLYEIIYSLNPAAPFRYVYQKENGKWYSNELDSIDKVCEHLHKYNKSSKSMVYYGYIQMWLEARQNAEGISKEELERIIDLINWLVYINKEYEKNIDAGLRMADYVFNPDMGYLSLDKETYCKTREEIGSEIVSNAGEYVDFLQDEVSDINLYIKSKVWSDVSDYITSCFNMDYHDNKIGPYNEFIATAKVINYLGITMSYNANDEWYSDPEELMKASSSVRKSLKEDVEDVDSVLMAWLSVHFQESIECDQDTTEYAYENKLLDMFNYLVKLNTGADITKRYDKAKKLVPRRVKREKAADTRLLMAKIVALILPLVSAVGLYLYVMGEGAALIKDTSIWNVSQNYYVIFIVLFVAYYFISNGFGEGRSLSAGCLGGPIIGLILAVIVYFIFRFTVGSPYIFGGILALILIVGYIKILGSGHSDSETRAEIFDMDDKVTFEYEPLAYALSDEEEFESQRLDILDQYRYARSFAWKALLKYGFLPTIIFLGSIGLFAANDPSFASKFSSLDKLTSNITQYIPDFSSTPEMTGMWEGKFNKTTMMMNVTKQDGENLSANISILYRTQQHSSATGTIKDKEVKLTDNKGGIYTGIYNDDDHTVSGDYDLNGKKSSFVITMKDAPKPEPKKAEKAPVKADEEKPVTKQTEAKKSAETQKPVTDPNTKKAETKNDLDDFEDYAKQKLNDPEFRKKLDDAVKADMPKATKGKETSLPVAAPVTKEVVQETPKEEPKPVIDYIATTSDRGFKVDILSCRRISGDRVRVDFRFTNTTKKSKSLSLVHQYTVAKDFRGSENEVATRILGDQQVNGAGGEPETDVAAGGKVTGSVLFDGMGGDKISKLELRVKSGGFNIYEFRNLEIK